MILRGSGGGGKGGGGGSAPVEAPDTLKSDQFATILDLISEGEIEGLVNGLQSVFLDDVPLQNADGSYNFEGVTVETRTGTEGQSAIGMVEGTQSEVSVGVEVKNGQPIERAITNSETDRVRVTLSVPQLSKTDTTNGNINGATVQYKISISANGGAFKDANVGGGNWVSFSGTTTPVACENFRAAIRWIPNVGKNGDLDRIETATIALQFRTGSGAWQTAGETTINTGYQQRVQVGLSSLFVGDGYVETQLFEVFSQPSAVYQLRAVLVSTTEASPGTVEVINAATGQTVPTGTITGKTTSRYQRSHIINLRSFGSPPYIVRVTRVTPDSTSATLVNQTFWDSYTEIVDEKLRYPLSALVAMRMSSKQFQGIPVRGYHVRGIKIKVPSNYDPIARTYTGIWDGTFKVAWSNNPAWIFYDLATNARYGVGDYVPAQLLDKWALYAIGQYCDGLVPNGRGGQEPRYTFNTQIQTRQQAYAALSSIAAAFRGITYWGASAVLAAADMPSEPTYQFTNANVVDGIFTYAGSGLRTRHNVALVTWNDPADMYRTKVEYVSDDEAIAAMGFVNQTEVVATGCTSQGQARRVGEWILYTERYENETVTFGTGLEGNIPRPNDVILIADRLKSGTRMGGRVVARTATTLQLDAPVTLAAGVTYTVSVITSTGELATATIENPAGTYTTLTWSVGSAPACAPDTIWVISGDDVEAQTFRVLSVVEQDGGHQFSITALRHYPSKYDYIERNQPLQVPDYSRLESAWSPPAAPTGINLTESLYIGPRGVTSRLTVSWQASASTAVAKYELQYRIGVESNWITVPPQAETTYDIENLNDGDAVYVALRSITTVGVRSTSPATATTTILGKTAPPSNVTGFVVSRAGDTLNFSWQHVPDVDRDHYEIRFGQAWTSAIPVGATSANGFSVEHLRGGTFLIKAFDTSGNQSVGAASVVATNSLAFLNAKTHDEATGGWNGSCTNCAPYSLSASVAWGDLANWSGFTSWDAGSSRTGILMNSGSLSDAVYVGETIDLGSKQTVQVSLNASIGAINGATTSWADLTKPWTAYTKTWPTYGGGITLSFASSLVVKVQIQTSDDGSTWSQALDFAPGTYKARYFRFVVRMNSTDPELIPYLFGLVAYFDLRERILHFEDAAIASGGTALTFSPAFVAVRTIQVTPQGGATGDTYKVSAKTNSGVTINLYNSAGTAKAGTVDVDIFGYGEA